MLKNEQDIINVIQDDKDMMKIINAAQTLDLPDWWICAGFVRSKIWDLLHGFQEATPIDDVDVVYFDPTNIDEATEKEFERKLHRILPGVPWSVKNEARMHIVNNVEPFKNTVDAISKFPETVTALGIKIDKDGKLIFTAPHGVEDVLTLTVRPTPNYKNSEEGMKIYLGRLSKKKWKEHWHNVIYLNE